MPIYAYKCAECGHELDVIRKVSDAPLTECPLCGKHALVKQVTAAGFQLKGGGWYVTDFRDAGSGKKKEAGKPEDKAAADQATESKADAKTESKTDGSADSKDAAKTEAKTESKTEPAKAPAAPAPKPGSTGTS